MRREVALGFLLRKMNGKRRSGLRRRRVIICLFHPSLPGATTHPTPGVMIIAKLQRNGGGLWLLCFVAALFYWKESHTTQQDLPVWRENCIG